MARRIGGSKGFGMVEVLVTSVLLGIVGLAFLQMFSSSRVAERGIAANADLSDTMRTVSLILESRSSCQKSGLLGIVIDPANPEATAVTLSLPGAAGPGPVFLSEGGKSGDTRSVSKLRFTSLSFLENVLAGRLYFSTLRFETAIVGKALTHRNPNRDIFLNLVLDAANTVVDCYQSGSSGLRVQTGVVNIAHTTANCPGTYAGGWCSQPYRTTVTFPVPFAQVPQVMASLRRANIHGVCGSTSDRDVVEVGTVTTTTAEITCGTSPHDCTTYGGWWVGSSCSWMAMGQ